MLRACACKAASGGGPLLFTYDSTIDSSEISRMNCEVHMAFLPTQIQPHAARLISRCFTVLKDNDGK